MREGRTDRRTGCFQVFKDDNKYRSVGKVAAVVGIYLRYAMGE